MLADGKAGRFGGLLVWKLDRFARNIRDGEDLIDLGVLLDGPDSGRIDLRTAHGKSVVRKQFEAATHLSNETSEKVRAAFADMLASGYRVGGSGRLFGFEMLSLSELRRRRLTTTRTTSPAGSKVRPRSCARPRPRSSASWPGGCSAGETVQSMADDLNERGITTTRGGRWEPRNLSRTLGNPLYGGQLAYKGEIIGRLAEVEPILDTETYEAVQAKLGARRRGRQVTGRYPLSGVLRCGNPACAQARHDGRVPAHRGPAGLHLRAGQRRLRAVGARRAGRGDRAGRVLAELADAERLEAMRAADATLDEQRAKLRSLLDDLDADMAETEAKLRDIPRGQTRRREQVERNLASMAARYEATGGSWTGSARPPRPPRRWRR